ncbi:hypothetical protein KEM55_003316 [Ascosphaera atra]|nr:hypothetical protein KEM55_003316 [Ascosphaera atra]
MALDRVLPMPKGLFRRSKHSPSSSRSSTNNGTKSELPPKTSSCLEPRIMSEDLNGRFTSTTSILPIHSHAQQQQQQFQNVETGSTTSASTHDSVNVLPSVEKNSQAHAFANNNSQGLGQLPPARTPYTPPSSDESSASPRVSPDRGIPNLPSMDVLASSEAAAAQNKALAPTSSHRRQLSGDSLRSCELTTPPADSPNGANSKLPSRFCLCQPDRKIPRPRNAFILFRQHLQLSVVAQNPGLSNPEISKIIGNQWQMMSPEAKQQWKDLAEEEKMRHQQQYPDYRYQPRRNGRNVDSSDHGPSSTVNANGVTVCTRCGGRILNANSMTPSETSTPTPTMSPHMGNGSFEPQIPAPPQSQPQAQSPPQPQLLQGMRPMHNLPSRLRMQSKRPKSLTINTSLQEYANKEQTVAVAANPLSPKRRRCSAIRLQNEYANGLSRGPSLRSPRSPSSNPRMAYAHQQRRLMRPHSHSLILPQRSQVLGSPPPNMGRFPGYFGEQRQPPLAHSMSQQQLGTQQQLGSGQAKAVIKNIPFLNKIKLLSIIAPPAGADPKNLDAVDVPALARERGGALIAVEGEDREAVHNMLRQLAELLSRNPRQIVKIFGGPDVGAINGPATAGRDDLSLQYLDTIYAWRKISYDIVDFITGSNTMRAAHGPSRPHTPDVGFRDPARMPSIQQMLDSSNNNYNTNTINSSAPPDQPFRIALVPRYQFTNAEMYACSAPINDSYAPADHWQWMASLWRFCTGPDLTIYIRDCEDQELVETNSVYNPVDVKLDGYRTLIVRRGRPGSGIAANMAGTAIEEKALRRVTFEVEEYLRR